MEAADRDPKRGLPGGPMWLPSSPEGPLPERSCPSRGNAVSLSISDEWLAQTSQETRDVWLHPTRNATPADREEGRGSCRGGGVGLSSKVGTGQWLSNKGLLVFCHGRAASWLPLGPTPPTPPGLTSLLTTVPTASSEWQGPSLDLSCAEVSTRQSLLSAASPEQQRWGDGVQ